MTHVDPITLRPTISLDAAAWFPTPLGQADDAIAAWSHAVASAAADERGCSEFVARSAAARLAHLAAAPSAPGVTARLVFLPDLVGLGIAYDVWCFDTDHGQVDRAAAHRLVAGADDVGEGAVADVRDASGEHVVGLQVFDVRVPEPRLTGGVSRGIPIAFSRCVIRRNSPVGDIDLFAAGASADIEAAALSVVPLELLLLGDELFS